MPIYDPLRFQEHVRASQLGAHPDSLLIVFSAEATSHELAAGIALICGIPACALAWIFGLGTWTSIPLAAVLAYVLARFSVRANDYWALLLGTPRTLYLDWGLLRESPDDLSRVRGLRLRRSLTLADRRWRVMSKAHSKGLRRLALRTRTARSPASATASMIERYVQYADGKAFSASRRAWARLDTYAKADAAEDRQQLLKKLDDDRRQRGLDRMERRVVRRVYQGVISALIGVNLLLQVSDRKLNVVWWTDGVRILLAVYIIGRTSDYCVSWWIRRRQLADSRGRVLQRLSDAMSRIQDDAARGWAEALVDLLKQDRSESTYGLALSLRIAIVIAGITFALAIVPKEVRDNLVTWAQDLLS